MEDFQAGAMADAHDRGLGQVLDQELHDVLLARLVERGGRLVHEDPLRLVDQRAREGDALLLAARQDLVPAVDLVEPVAQMIEADLVQGLFQNVVGDALGRLRVVHRLAQGSEREVRLLRHKDDAAGRQVDVAVAPRPDAGHRAHDRALAATGLPADQHTLGPRDLDLGIGHQRLAGRAREAEFAQHQHVDIARRMQRDVLVARAVGTLLEVVQRVMQVHDAVARGAPLGELGEVVDQPAERPLHAREGLGGLHQAAELDLSAQVARQRHDQRHDRREVGQRTGEQREVALPARLAVPGGAQLEQRAAQPLALVALAAQQRDALGVLARAVEARAEICLAALAHVARLDQPAAERIGQDRSDKRVRDRGPNHVARHVEVHAEDVHRQVARERPQHGEEGEELQDALQDALRELAGELGRDADVLGDAAVGIVDFVGEQAELVLAARGQPALDGGARQPRAPIDLQTALHVKLDGDADTGRHDDRGQDPQEVE